MFHAMFDLEEQSVFHLDRVRGEKRVFRSDRVRREQLVFQILKVLNCNTENPYLIWDNATRMELNEFLTDQQHQKIRTVRSRCTLLAQSYSKSCFYVSQSVASNDLYLDWIGLCPRNGVFSLVLANCGDAYAVEFFVILNFCRYYICAYILNIP